MLSKKLLCLFLFGAVLFEQTFSQDTEGEGESESTSEDESENESSSENEGEPTTTSSSNSVSSSSSSDSATACFSEDSIVTRQTGDEWEYALLKDIKLGDYVLSSENGEYMFTEVLHRLHYLTSDGSDEQIPMRKICTDASCVTMTADHLLYVNGNELDNLVNAGEAKIGDLVYSQDDFHVIVSILDNVMAYPRDVLTRNGNVVVNEVLASAYIGNNKWDHLVLSTVMKSLHYLANDMPYLYDIIADGPAIWKNEEITTQIHQIILFSYFNIYQAIVSHVMTVASLACGFGVFMFLQTMKN